MTRKISRARRARIEASKQALAKSMGIEDPDDVFTDVSLPEEMYAGKPRLSTGSLGSDDVSGGGILIGSTALLWGVESGGKSFTAQKIAASAQHTCTHCKTPIEPKSILPPINSDDAATQEHIDGIIQCPDCYCYYHKDLAPPQRYADIEGLLPEDLEGLNGDECYCSKCGSIAPIEEFVKPNDVDMFGLATNGPVRCDCGACEPMIVTWVDFEKSFDPVWAAQTGMVVEDLQYFKPQYGEQALDGVLELLGQGATDVVVIDSIAGVTSYKEMENSLHDAHMALTARLMASFFRKWDLYCTKSLLDHGVTPTLVLINQVRHKIGALGNPDTAFGGNAQWFYSSTTLKFAASKTDVDQRAVGAKSRKEHLSRVNKTMCSVQAVKNKTSSRQRAMSTFTIASSPQGRLQAGEVIDQAYIWDTLRKIGLLEEYGRGKNKGYRIQDWPNMQSKGIGYHQEDYIFSGKAEFIQMLCDVEGFARFWRQFIPRYTDRNWADIQERLKKIDFKKPAGL